ncbi:Hypothetical_protein [Hexamita inflata]|uniref:Hypothetical_protein n=1 Tax=Hexamita inflata TaxID=28002 RepID=A0AA86Q1U8_9EUKA|nr:Hypothetical protein HINF_LOCUS32482 [Hexamita inflata]
MNEQRTMQNDIILIYQIFWKVQLYQLTRFSHTVIYAHSVKTQPLADQFYLIRQLNFQKLVLASQFLFARYFLRLAREVVPLYWHCLVVVAFDALFHQLDQVPGVLLSLFDFANSQFWGILPVVDQLFPRVQLL